MESQQTRPKHHSVFLLGIFLFLFSIAPTWAQAPNPPTPIEFMFGHERMDFQLVFKRNFTPQSKFSVLAIAVFSENYAKGKRLGDSVVIPFQVNYAIGKSGLSLVAGAEANSVTGLGTTLGLSHNKASKEILAISVLSYQLSSAQNLKFFGLYEYKPALTEKLSLYSRLQITYNQGMAEGFHNRSFLYLRAGLKKGPLGFGLGANFDAYGPSKVSRENYGVFTRWEF
ncbi:MAG: hypothetical protein LW824_17700 [Algoriphagus sp.]|jgi:hypothetical protein|nr:hypothetical protein [Algoriphagus sp.]